MSDHGVCYYGCGLVPVATVVGVAVKGECPSSLNVSWTPLSVSELRGPDHASFYYITYSTLQGSLDSVTIPYLSGSSVKIEAGVVCGCCGR